jgi:hypothetical protein
MMRVRARRKESIPSAAKLEQLVAQPPLVEAPRSTIKDETTSPTGAR